MQISFFEEFPTKENLDKIKLIKQPTKLYIAAKNLESFNQAKKFIKSKRVKEIIYWPILDKKEGYWISPFSKRKALHRIFEELYGKKIPLMLDLELPTSQNPKLYLTQFIKFKKNKDLIRNFINSYKGPIYLAEYYPQGRWHEFMLRLLGLHYDNSKVKIIKMVYHSMHNLTSQFLEKEYQQGVNQYGNKFLVGLGTIAVGIAGNEPVLSGELLKRDLKLAEKHKVNECIIFRLGGLQPNYLNILYPKKSASGNKEISAHTAATKRLKG